MTGMYQTSIGAHNHRSNRGEHSQPLPNGVRVFTEYFRNAGYFVSNARDAGKVEGKNEFNFQPGKTDLNFEHGPLYDGISWRQRDAVQPFFALVQFADVHRDFHRDPENPIDADEVTTPPYYPDHEMARRDWANYLENVQVLDRKVGTVLNMLENDGLADNTIVIFTSDHGRAHLRGKQFLYEGGIHIPFIIRWPDGEKAGTVNDEMISAIDFAPTFMKMAGLKAPDHFQGRNFLREDNEREYIISARDRCDETVDRIRAVRTKNFKYIRNYYPNKPYTQTNVYKKRQYPMLALLREMKANGTLTEAQKPFMADTRPYEELYNLEEDPHEVDNLADDPAYEDRKKGLSEKLDTWIVATGDQGVQPEKNEVVIKWYQQARERWQNFTENEGIDPEITDAAYIEKYWKEEMGLK